MVDGIPAMHIPNLHSRSLFQVLVIMKLIAQVPSLADLPFASLPILIDMTFSLLVHFLFLLDLDMSFSKLAWCQANTFWRLSVGAKSLL